MFLSFDTLFVCMLIDAVKNNPIIVLFNHEGIAIIETMAPTLNCEMLIAFNVFYT